MQVSDSEYFVCDNGYGEHYIQLKNGCSVHSLNTLKFYQEVVSFAVCFLAVLHLVDEWLYLFNEYVFNSVGE